MGRDVFVVRPRSRSDQPGTSRARRASLSDVRPAGRQVGPERRSAGSRSVSLARRGASPTMALGPGRHRVAAERRRRPCPRAAGNACTGASGEGGRGGAGDFLSASKSPGTAAHRGRRGRTGSGAPARRRCRWSRATGRRTEAALQAGAARTAHHRVRGSAAGHRSRDLAVEVRLLPRPAPSLGPPVRCRSGGASWGGRQEFGHSLALEHAPASRRGDRAPGASATAGPRLRSEFGRIGPSAPAAPPHPQVGRRADQGRGPVRRPRGVRPSRWDAPVAAAAEAGRRRPRSRAVRAPRVGKDRPRRTVGDRQADALAERAAGRAPPHAAARGRDVPFGDVGRRQPAVGGT